MGLRHNVSEAHKRKSLQIAAAASAEKSAKFNNII